MLILKLKLKVEGGGDHFWRRSIDDVKCLKLSMIEAQNVVSDAHSCFARYPTPIRALPVPSG